MTTIAWINEQTMICENISLDPRPASEIVISGYLLLDLDAIGGGGIGHTWDGEKLTPPSEVQNEASQPETSGTQEL
jgi:hypothetical protein